MPISITKWGLHTMKNSLQFLSQGARTLAFRLHWKFTKLSSNQRELKKEEYVPPKLQKVEGRVCSLVLKIYFNFNTYQCHHWERERRSFASVNDHEMPFLISTDTSSDSISRWSKCTKFCSKAASMWFRQTICVLCTLIYVYIRN